VGGGTWFVRVWGPVKFWKATNSGALLSAEDIRSMSEPGAATPLIADLDVAGLKGAAYDLRIADDGLVLPGGVVVRPGEGPYRQPILLEPGHTIFVSTLERLRLPSNIAGNISIKGQLADQGILALTGLIVDPTYSRGGSGDGRLHFRLANLGPRPVLLQPRVTKFASIQFIRLTRPTGVGPGHSFDDVWERIDDYQGGLGFIEDLRRLEERVGGAEQQLDRQARLVGQVVPAVMVVVVLTLMGVVLTGLLSLGSDSKIVDAAQAVVPDTGSGKAFFLVALFSAPVFAFALVNAFRMRRERHSPNTDSLAYARKEALWDLRADRLRRLSLASCALAAIVVAAFALVEYAGVVWWLATLGGIAAFALGLIVLWDKIWQPLPRAKINERVRDWEQQALDAGK
jgi:dCTP deaminase